MHGGAHAALGRSRKRKPAYGCAEGADNVWSRPAARGKAANNAVRTELLRALGNDICLEAKTESIANYRLTASGTRTPLRGTRKSTNLMPRAENNVSSSVHAQQSGFCGPRKREVRAG
jgi:hypothetical protein